MLQYPCRLRRQGRTTARPVGIGGTSQPSANQGASREVQMCLAGRGPGSLSSVATRRMTCGWAGRSAGRSRRPSVASLRPAPRRRIRPVCLSDMPASSLSPRPIVLRAIPVAADTASMPPCPSARASLAATNQPVRSSRNGSSAAKRARMASALVMPPPYDRTLPSRTRNRRFNSCQVRLCRILFYQIR